MHGFVNWSMHACSFDHAWCSFGRFHSTKYVAIASMLVLLFPTVSITRADADGFIVGNKTRTISIRVRRQFGLVMNFGAPSPQRGVVTSWNFYYACVPRNDIYHATFMMYRPTGNNSQYQVLPDSIQPITVECENTGIVLRGNRTLTTEEQFRVEEGDIVGICFPNDALRIVSMFNTNRDGVSNTRVLNINQDEGCTSERLQMINLQSLILRQDFRLHLYANAMAGKIYYTMLDCMKVMLIIIYYYACLDQRKLIHSLFPIVAEITTTTNDPSNNTKTTTSGDSVSNSLPTLTTNRIIGSRFNPSLDLVVIKIIIISLSVAVLVIAMIIVVILVMAIAVMWRRKRIRRKNSTTVDESDCQNCYYSAIYFTGTTTEFNMNDNVSYNIHDMELPSQHYEYPDISTTVLDGSNIYETIDPQ